jgi:tRNA(Arg) A34 adenosine deaminase TadA
MRAPGYRTTVQLTQPHWLEDWLARPPPPPDPRARLAEVLELAALNIAREGGAPFAAAVYRLDTPERLSAAVNTTIPSHCSAAHAELQALSLAQQALGLHCLGTLPCILVTSSAPCTMCLGAIAWSGVQGLVYATPRQDVEALGFDEGPATPRWRQELVRRGIAVSGPWLRQRGRTVLEHYRELGGPIYNPHRPGGCTPPR